MENLEGKTIVYLCDVGSPASQAGRMGDSRVVSRELNFAANYLLRGRQIRVIDPAELHAVRVELGLEKPKPKTERKAHVPRTYSRTDQPGDSGKEESPGAGRIC